MCATCGCGDSHSHHHDHQDEAVSLEKSILSTNDKYAQQNRGYLKAKKNLALNFVSSPGSGKTSLLEATIKKLSTDYNVTVIEGDQQTELDADRIRNAGADAHQIQTGKACHLDAHMVGHAFEHLDVKDNGFCFIENVGNLICPAMFDLGEDFRVALISTTEGDDKPLKYPDMFYYSDVVVVNKTDLLPYVNFSVENCVNNIKKIKSDLKIFETSVTSSEGLAEWLEWLKEAFVSKVGK